MTTEKQRWVKVKAKIIARYLTVRAAARLAGCHPNAFRHAANGRCPRIVAWLEVNL